MTVEYEDGQKHSGPDLPGVGNKPLRTVIYRLVVSDITASAGTEAIAVSTLTPINGVAMATGDRPVCGAHKLETVFAGGGSGNATLDVGEVSGNLDGLLDGADVFTGASTTYAENAGDGTFVAFADAAYLPVISISSDVNVDLLTTGSVVVYITYLAGGDPLLAAA